MLGPYHQPTTLVLGLGDSGLAMANWCARQGCELYLADTRATPPHAAHAYALDQQKALHCGPFTPALLNLPSTDTQQPGRPIELIALSPGLSPLEPGLASLLAVANQRQIPVWGELEFFAQALKALHIQGYTPKVLAITGTNGKTTTTALTGLLCKHAGLRTVIAGNIGPSLLDSLGRALDATSTLQDIPFIDTVQRTMHAVGTNHGPIDLNIQALPEVWVLELSSFQLQSTCSFCPDAAALLNMSVDHLDWHESFEAYARAKARIFGPASLSSSKAHAAIKTDEEFVRVDSKKPDSVFQYDQHHDLAIQDAHTLRVLNRDDPHSLRFAERDAARAPSLHTSKTVTFGLDIPQHAGDWGIEESPGKTWIVRAKPAASAPKTQAHTHSDPHKAPIQIEYIIPAHALRIQGRHNLANALAALALCGILDVPLTPLLQGLREYSGEAHRFEHVASFDGLCFIDDSKATNVGATLAALYGLMYNNSHHVVLILGGEGKGQDFSDLVEPIAQTCRAVMLIGQAAPDLRATLLPSGVPLYDCATLEEATRTAASLAEPGNTILLSPCCASLDMFRNYIHRAEIFRQTIGELAAHSGATA